MDFPIAREIQEALLGRCQHAIFGYKNGKYSIDFPDLEKKIVEHQLKLYILCSPHNPVGRVWSREELLKLGDICLAHDVLIVSDEIHSDFVWGDNKHTVFASLGADYAQNCVACPRSTLLQGLELLKWAVNDL